MWWYNVRHLLLKAILAQCSRDTWRLDWLKVRTCVSTNLKKCSRNLQPPLHISYPVSLPKYSSVAKGVSSFLLVDGCTTRMKLSWVHLLYLDHHTSVQIRGRLLSNLHYDGDRISSQQQRVTSPHRQKSLPAGVCTEWKSSRRRPGSWSTSS